MSAAHARNLRRAWWARGVHGPSPVAPSGFTAALLASARAACRDAAAPHLAAAYLPEPYPDPERDAEFGALVLADGSAGLYYAWLGEDQRGLGHRLPLAQVLGRPVSDLIGFFESSDVAERSLGLAAINALTSWLWHRRAYVPPPAADAFCGVVPLPGERVGFIGNFPPLVRRLLAQGTEVAVVERKPHMWRVEPGLEITPDPTALTDCGVIFGTASMCLNDSLDEMLGWCSHAREVVILGPTAGFFPEPLFERGVTRVGGLQLTDAVTAVGRMRLGEKWQADCARRFVIEARSPGPL